MSSERNAEHSTKPAEVWKSWNETTTGTWTRTPERRKRKDTSRDLFGPYRVWMMPTIYSYQRNATCQIWAQMIGKMMRIEPLLEAHDQFLKTSLHIVRDASLLAHTAMFPNRWMPARPDVAQAAKLVATLEERVYAIEDALVDGGERDAQVSSDPMECLSTCQRTEVRGDLAGRLERLEGKMDILLATLAKIEAKVSQEEFSPGSDLCDKPEKA